MPSVCCETCYAEPCACHLPLNYSFPNGPTRCDRYDPSQPNVWVEKGGPGYTGICMLDTMTDDQIIYTLIHDDKAREDLAKITTDPTLLAMVQEVPKLPGQSETDREQALVNMPHEIGTAPLYSVFRGKPPETKPNSK